MKVDNRRAKFNYHIRNTFEAGISLNGQEARAARQGKIDLSNSFGKIISNEAYLINTRIDVANPNKYSPTRTRKLLLHKNQIDQLLAETKAKKLTLIALSMYTKNRLIKVKLALAKAKKKYEKKEIIKRREIEKEIKSMKY